MAITGVSINSYRDLLAWQSAMDVVEQIYKLTAHFPKGEMYGLVSQMQRAAVSIPSNIAEGHARASTKEYLRFVSVSLGSTAELETQIALAQRLGYLSDQQVVQVCSDLEKVGKMLRGLQKSLRAKVRI